MCAIVGTEEAFGSRKKRVVMLVPTHTLSGAKSIRNFRLISHTPAYHFEKAREKNRALFIRERHSLLGRKRIFPGRRVISNKSARSLRRQPFAYVPLRRLGFRGDLYGSHLSRAGHCFVKPEFVAHDDQSCIHRGSHFTDGFHYEFMQLRFIGGLWRESGHGFSLR